MEVLYRKEGQSKASYYFILFSPSFRSSYFSPKRATELKKISFVCGDFNYYYYYYYEIN
jgi:hypothetical protein